jgi:tetratricopeptide (TPR) repeat protein
MNVDVMFKRYAAITAMVLLLPAYAYGQSLVYQQSFSQPDPQWSDHQDMYMTEKVENNKFVITQSRNKFSYQAVEVALEDGRDYSVETVVTHISGVNDGPFGLVFAGDGPANYYVFAVSSDGRYVLGGESQGVFTPIIKWRPSAAVKKGNGQPNKLRIETEGDNLKLLINGIQVNKIAMPQPFGNDVGFMVGKPQTDAFDYLAVGYMADDSKPAVTSPATSVKANDIAKHVAVPAAKPAAAPPVSIPVPAVEVAPQASYAADSLQKYKISLKDAKEISYQAQATIVSLQNLLNYVTFSDNAASEQAEVIANSYQPSRNRVFFSRDAIIENDIDPKFMLGNSVDVTAEKYLNQLDLQYEKTQDESIKFSNIYISDVKKKDYIYVKARFDVDYGSKYKPDGSTYNSRQRQAEIRLQNTGSNKWEALIASVSFYNPAQPAESKDNDMQVATDTSAAAGLISQEDFDREKQSFILARQQEEKKQQAIFDDYVTEGNNYVSNKQFKEALEMYTQAKALKPLVPTLDRRIIDVKKLIGENTFSNYKRKGDIAKVERRFNDAIQDYKQAIALSPDSSASLPTEISQLTQLLAIISLPSNKLQSGDAQGAIDECERVLHENKKEKNQYPELYLTEALAYEKLSEGKPDDKHDLDKALLNLNMAILYNTNFKDARLARAEFFVTHRNDIASAITDYDVLTSNELDDSPDKPMFFASKARLKSMSNLNDDALADYQKAISLSPGNPLFYFDKGQLQYKLGAVPDAEQSFSAAINLDSKYGISYYYRGLNFVKSKNYSAAGKDFSRAAALGLTDDQSKTIDVISNDFFLKGDTLSAAHDFTAADTAYDNALKIKNTNADALHGKADNRLVTGNELCIKKDTAGAFLRYKASITLNRQSVLCRPDFSDAHFKEGLAYSKIAAPDSAIICFTDALKSDNANIQALIERGNVYLWQKKYAKAADDYAQGIQLLQTKLEEAKKNNDKTLLFKTTGDLSKCWCLTGQAQYDLADYIDAIQSLSKAIDIVETNHEAYYYRALVYTAQNESSKALRDLGEALKIRPEVRYYYQNGKVNLDVKNYPEAINNFSQAIGTDSSNTFRNKIYLRGYSYLKNKQFTEAVNDFDDYNKTANARSDTAFRAYYGVALLFTSQDSTAAKSFNQSLRLSPNNPIALFGMGCYYAHNNHFELAIVSLEKGLETRLLTKDDIKQMEDTFLVDFNKVKANKQKYGELKRANLIAKD